jgi:glycosyltransferase involved in cell wall biosynthesis
MGGLPILCSNYKNLHNIVKNNPIGIVGDTFNVNSIKSIENAIKLMIENRLYKKYKNNALELASKFFNWESEEKKILQIYNNITL